ncbi:MAG: PilZ domain-containing protein [Phycisphaerales bacterium]|nr:PilZ domain-containing protein [Phycisphaerales bacterium]
MPSSGLIVRRTERFEISLPARVRVASGCMDIVQFAKGIANDERWIEVDVVDFAQGGIGFVSDIFFARSLDLEIEVPNFQDPDAELIIQCEMQVKRVQMTDRRPAYLIGCAFIGLDDDKKSSIENMIDRLRGMADTDQNDGDSHA